MASNGPELPVEDLANDLQWAQYNLRGDHTDGPGLTVILENVVSS